MDELDLIAQLSERAIEVLDRDPERQPFMLELVKEYGVVQGLTKFCDGKAD